MHSTCGTLGFTRGNRALHRVTAWMTKARKELATLATHQLSFYDPNEIIQAVRKQGVVRGGWCKERELLDNAGYEWCLATLRKPLSEPEELIIKTHLDEMVGWQYSKMELPLQALDSLVFGKLFGRRVGLDAIYFRYLSDLWKKGVICSTTSNRPLIKAHRLPEWLKYGAPDDTWDHVYEHPDEWLIGEHSPNWFNPKAKVISGPGVVGR